MALGNGRLAGCLPPLVTNFSPVVFRMHRDLLLALTKARCRRANAMTLCAVPKQFNDEAEA